MLGSDMELQGIPRVESGRSWKGSEKSIPISRASSGRSVIATPGAKWVEAHMSRINSERELGGQVIDTPPERVRRVGLSGGDTSPEVMGVKKVSFNLNKTIVQRDDELEYSHTSLSSLDRCIHDLLDSPSLRSSRASSLAAMSGSEHQASPLAHPRTSPQSRPALARAVDFDTAVPDPAAPTTIDPKQAAALLSLCDPQVMTTLSDNDFVDKICRALGMSPNGVESKVDVLERIVRAAATAGHDDTASDIVRGARQEPSDLLALSDGETFAGGEDGGPRKWAFGAVDAPVFQAPQGLRQPGYGEGSGYSPSAERESVPRGVDTPLSMLMQATPTPAATPGPHGHYGSQSPSVQSSPGGAGAAAQPALSRRRWGALPPGSDGSAPAGAANGGAAAPPLLTVPGSSRPHSPVSGSVSSTQPMESPATSAGTGQPSFASTGAPANPAATAGAAPPRPARSGTAGGRSGKRGLVVGVSYQQSKMFRLDHDMVEAAVQQSEWLLQQDGVETTVLLENPDSVSAAGQPTRGVLFESIEKMIESAVPGDMLFLVLVGRPEMFLSRAGFAPWGEGAQQAHVSGDELLGTLLRVKQGVSWTVVSDLTPPAVVVEGLPWGASVDADGVVQTTLRQLKRWVAPATPASTAVASPGPVALQRRSVLKPALKQTPPSAPSHTAHDRADSPQQDLRTASPINALGAHVSRIKLPLETNDAPSTGAGSSEEGGSDSRTPDQSQSISDLGIPPHGSFATTMKIPKGGFPVNVKAGQSDTSSSDRKESQSQSQESPVEKALEDAAVERRTSRSTSVSDAERSTSPKSPEGSRHRTFSGSVDSNPELMKTLPLEYEIAAAHAAAGTVSRTASQTLTDASNEAKRITVLAARGFGYAVDDQRILNYTGAIVTALLKASMVPPAPTLSNALKFIQSELDGVAAYCGDAKPPRAVLAGSHAQDVDRDRVPYSIAAASMGGGGNGGGEESVRTSPQLRAQAGAPTQQQQSQTQAQAPVLQAQQQQARVAAAGDPVNASPPAGQGGGGPLHLPILSSPSVSSRQSTAYSPTLTPLPTRMASGSPTSPPRVPVLGAAGGPAPSDYPDSSKAASLDNTAEFAQSIEASGIDIHRAVWRRMPQAARDPTPNYTIGPYTGTEGGSFASTSALSHAGARVGHYSAGMRADGGGDAALMPLGPCGPLMREMPIASLPPVAPQPLTRLQAPATKTPDPRVPPPRKQFWMLKEEHFTSGDDNVVAEEPDDDDDDDGEADDDDGYDGSSTQDTSVARGGYIRRRSLSFDDPAAARVALSIAECKQRVAAAVVAQQQQQQQPPQSKQFFLRTSLSPARRERMLRAREASKSGSKERVREREPQREAAAAERERIVRSATVTAGGAAPPAPAQPPAPKRRAFW